MRSHQREVRGMRESELLAMADVAMQEEVIETHERELIHSIIGFGDTIVREVMVPRPDMRTMEADLAVSKALDVAIAAGFSRLPVHEGNLDDVVGIAFAKDLIRAEREGHGDEPVRDFARPRTSCPRPSACRGSCVRCRSASSTRRSSSTSTAAPPGWSPSRTSSRSWWARSSTSTTSRSRRCCPSGDGEVSVTARLPVDELNELLDAELPEGDWDTVGGLLFNVLGRVPVEGESVDVDGVRLVAERVQGNRIGRIRISPLHVPGPAGSEPARIRRRGLSPGDRGRAPRRGRSSARGS